MSCSPPATSCARWTLPSPCPPPPRSRGWLPATCSSTAPIPLRSSNGARSRTAAREATSSSTRTATPCPWVPSTRASPLRCHAPTCPRQAGPSCSTPTAPAGTSRPSSATASPTTSPSAGTRSWASIRSTTAPATRPAADQRGWSSTSRIRAPSETTPDSQLSTWSCRPASLARPPWTSASWDRACSSIPSRCGSSVTRREG